MIILRCLILVFVAAVALFGGCRAPISSFAYWQPSISVQYAFAVGYGSPDLISAYGMGPDISSAIDLFNFANTFRNTSGVQFFFAGSGPFRFFADGGFDIAHPDRAAQRALQWWHGTNILYAANTTFWLGSSGWNVSGSRFHLAVKKLALHEIGHTFRLADQPIVCPSPQVSIMNVGCGVNDSSGNIPSDVTSCDNDGINITY